MTIIETVPWGVNLGPMGVTIHEKTDLKNLMLQSLEKRTCFVLLNGLILQIVEENVKCGFFTALDPVKSYIFVHQLHIGRYRYRRYRLYRNADRILMSSVLCVSFFIR